MDGGHVAFCSDLPPHKSLAGVVRRDIFHGRASRVHTTAKYWLLFVFYLISLVVLCLVAVPDEEIRAGER